MRTYELMLVLKVDSAHDDEKKQKALVDKLMTEQVYSNVSITDMGKKQLAYEIQKLKEGRYVLVTFEAETVNAARLEQQIKLTDDVLRHLLTRTK